MSSSAPPLLDRFVPQFDVRGRHEITVCAPAWLVMDVARNFEIESIWVVRILFRLRARLLGASVPAAPRTGLVNQMLSIGWQPLADEPGLYFIAGAACQPWQPDPAFSPIAPGDFASFSAPDRVKIAWTLEAAEMSPALTRFSTETRAVATDEPARAKFRRYWRKFGAGIILIRLVLLPAVRQRAERLWRTHPSRAQQ